MSRHTVNFSDRFPCWSRRRTKRRRLRLEESECIEVDRHDIAVLLQRKPMAGMEHAYRAGQAISRFAAVGAGAGESHPNEIIEKEMTFGERIATRLPGLVARGHLSSHFF